MKKRKVFAAALLAVVLAATFVTPTFAYEDGYAEDGDIQWRFAEDYYHGIYTLPTGISKTTSTLTLFLVTEDAWFIRDWSITYEFEGKMNLDEEYPGYGFNIDVGLVSNHSVTSTVELGDIDGNVRQMQVGIYPGYYNFYNYGYNAVNRENTNKWYAITLGPNWRVYEDQEYKNYGTVPDDAFVEVQEGENKRVYVLVGEEPFIETVHEAFEDWAIETEAHYVEESMVNGDHEEIEVEVPEENLEYLFESAQVEVGEVEESTPASVFEEPTPGPVFKETTPPSEESAAKSSFPWKIVVIAAAVALALVIYRKSSK